MPGGGEHSCQVGLSLHLVLVQQRRPPTLVDFLELLIFVCRVFSKIWTAASASPDADAQRNSRWRGSRRKGKEGSRVLWSTCVLRLHLTKPFCFNACLRTGSAEDRPRCPEQFEVLNFANPALYKEAAKMKLR